MQKIQGISVKQQREYLLLQYLLDVQQRLDIEDVRLYEDRVMHFNTFRRLRQDLQSFEQLYLSSASDGAKGGASDPSRSF